MTCFFCAKRSRDFLFISADFSHTEQQLNDQFDKISNDLLNLNLFISSSDLILSNQTIIQSPHSKAKTSEDIYEIFHKNQKFDSNLTSNPIQNLVVSIC